MKENTKKVFIKNFGCQMNVRDTEVVCGLLEKAGFSITGDSDTADVVVLNTCSVRQHAEDKVWSEIGRIAKRNMKKPIIGVIGCMAQNYKEAIFEKAEVVDFVVGPSDIATIPDIISQFVSRPSSLVHRSLYEAKIWQTDGHVRPDEIYHTGYREDKDHAYVVISEGCSNYCSYCVVPFVRGNLHHRNATAIVREISQAVGQGITSVTLLGQNVNAYSDGSVNFVTLLEMVEAVDGIEEISFITSHPKDTQAQLFSAMATLKKVKKYLHLPVQSGSDRILERMNRGYTRKYYLDLVRQYRTMVPGGILTTDIIVGFPGESEDDFQGTYDLVEKIAFDAGFIFKYSPRPDTQAARLPDDVPVHQKQRRHRLILDLQKEISKAKKKC